jgi:N-acetylglucosamine kinase-like BadF-type ATPase
MILIADSGSTKTMWKCTDGAGKVLTAHTDGINPYYNTFQEIARQIKKAKAQLSTARVEEIHFYGAGCATDIQKEMVSRALTEQFDAAIISVNTDLLGAARALFQEDPGIVCILGTGSGSCVYDGKGILRSIPSLGFILGDEGSGAYMGKKFVRDLLREDMPADLLEEIHKKIGVTKEEVLRHVNQEPMPSRYLAGYSKLIHEKIGHPYMHDLAFHSFKEFIDEYVIRYDRFRDYQIGFVGSIAVQYRDILKDVLLEYQITLSKVENNPVEGLIEYHLM